MSKPILCLDFDGVIHSYTSGWKGPNVIPDDPVPGALEFILEARKSFSVAIFSSRSCQAGGMAAMQGWLLSHLLKICKEAGGDYDFGEETLANVIDSIMWPTEKPPAMVTIDDRALTFTGTWPSIEALMDFKPWNKS